MTSGPPASLTRSGAPRFWVAIQASPLASAEIVSLFCWTSLRTFGLSCSSQDLHAASSASVML